MPTSPLDLRAVLLDWAGTTVDHGSRAPARVFVEVFRRQGVEITVGEARGPMGRAKWDHLVCLAELPRVAGLWRQVHGRAATEADIQVMYDQFLPLQKEILARETEMIPGVVPAVERLRQAGLKIGSTTGYTRELMEVVVPLAAGQGYTPDVTVCADDVLAGRPAPWMNFRAAEQLGVFPLSRVVVVDDTPVGIESGRNAGAWAVAVSQTGNSLGLSDDEVRALPAEDLQRRLAEIEREFYARGADLVVRSVAELPERLVELHGRPGDVPRAR